MKESKNERFKRLAEARVNRILDMLKLLGNCSFKGTYEYTDEQVEKVFQKLQSELDKTHKLFRSGSGHGRFSLSDNEENRSEFPCIFLNLPDGTRLRASAVDDENFPAINVWLQSCANEDEQSIAFVEYNSEREKGKELCVGVCNSESSDPYFYASFNSDTHK